MSTPLATLLQQAVDLHRAGRIEEAVRAYKKILRKDARAAGALNLLGLAQFQLGHLPEAAEALTRAAKLSPELPNVDFNLGRVLHAQGRHAEALQRYQTAVARAPNDAEALCNLGATLTALGRNAEAIDYFQRAVAIDPRLAEGWFNLGREFQAAERFEDAATAFRHALESRPNHSATMSRLAYVLNRLDRSREAATLLNALAAAEPDVADHHMNLANTLATEGRDDEALKAYDRAIKLDPGLLQTLWNKGQLLLSRGRFAEGWPFYDQRWNDASSIKMVRRPYSAPRWAGERVAGTLLVWAEQGLGDQVLHSSMMADLQKRAGKVVLEVDRRLVPLLARSFPGIDVVAQETAVFAGPIDAQTALGDIGQYLRLDAASFAPSAGGYLAADPERAAALQTRLHGDGRRVIGLSWGSTNKDIGRFKSAQLSELLPVLQLPGCRFIDLQYGDTRADRAQAEAATGVHIEHLDDIDNTNDIDGLAALMTACDAVVTVSNTNAHLAAALGKPTFVLLSDAAGLIWYWMKRGESTPFYANARLFRKGHDQSWTELAANAVAPQLKNYLDSLGK